MQRHNDTRKHVDPTADGQPPQQMTKQTSLQATKQTTGARDPFDGFQQDYGLQQGGDGEGDRKSVV